MDVTLKPGEGVRILFEDTDGIISVNYGKTGLRVRANMPDNRGRKGLLYEALYAGSCDDDEANEVVGRLHGGESCK